MVVPIWQQGQGNMFLYVACKKYLKKEVTSKKRFFFVLEKKLFQSN
jgi:hypothetical protein